MQRRIVLVLGDAGVKALTQEEIYAAAKGILSATSRSAVAEQVDFLRSEGYVDVGDEGVSLTERGLRWAAGIRALLPKRVREREVDVDVEVAELVDDFDDIKSELRQAIESASTTFERAVLEKASTWLKEHPVPGKEWDERRAELAVEAERALAIDDGRTILDCVIKVAAFFDVTYRWSSCPHCGRSSTAHTGSYCHDCGESLMLKCDEHPIVITDSQWKDWARARA